MFALVRRRVSVRMALTHAASGAAPDQSRARLPFTRRGKGQEAESESTRAFGKDHSVTIAAVTGEGSLAIGREPLAGPDDRSSPSSGEKFNPITY